MAQVGVTFEQRLEGIEVDPALPLELWRHWAAAEQEGFEDSVAGEEELMEPVAAALPATAVLAAVEQT